MEQAKVGKERDREKEGVREKLCRALDLSPDLLPGGCTLEVRDRHLLTLRGGGSILTYTEEEVRIALSRGALAVRGRRLTCLSYYVGAVSVEGEIGSITFEEERKR